MKSTVIRAVGFDLGETLVHYRDTPLSWEALYPDALAAVAARCGATPTAPQFAAAENILRKYNSRITPRTREVSADEILGAILEAWSLAPAAQARAATEAFFNFFHQRLGAYPDAAPALAALRGQRVPVGLLTDVPYGMPRDFVLRDLDSAGLAGRFDVVLTSVDVGARKPEPIGFLTLARQLGVEPGSLLYVGNEPKDVAGARGAGAFAAFLDRRRSGEFHGQNFTLDSLARVQELIRHVPQPAP